MSDAEILKRMKEKQIRKATNNHDMFMANRKFEKLPDYGVVVDRNLITKGYPAFCLLFDVGMVKSKNFARNLINQGGAYINKERIKTPNQKITLNDVKNDQIILRVGKKQYLTIFVGKEKK